MTDAFEVRRKQQFFQGQKGSHSAHTNDNFMGHGLTQLLYSLLYHTDAKYQFLFRNSMFMKSTLTLNLNFPAKNGIIENLIF